MVMDKSGFTGRFPLLLHRGENLVYSVIAIFMLLAAFLLLGETIHEFTHVYTSGSFLGAIIHIVAQMLLALMIVEILHTVRMSLLARQLLPEPFLIVGLIAAVRRILVISLASAQGELKPDVFQTHMIESGVLGALVLLFVVAIVLLRRYPCEQETRN